VVFPAFRLKNLIDLARRDLKYGEFSRFKKFFQKRLPGGSLFRVSCCQDEEIGTGAVLGYEEISEERR
jgi:hypothetical protein